MRNIGMVYRRQEIDGFANVMQWHDRWWFWGLEHCVAGYGFSHTLGPEFYWIKPPDPHIASSKL